jgi:hypothetical protein
MKWWERYWWVVVGAVVSIALAWVFPELTVPD